MGFDGLDMGSLVSALGAVSKGIGQYQSMQNQADAMDSQAAAYNYNAQIADQNAQAARDAAAADAAKTERQRQLAMGSTSVQFLNSGVLLSGSPLAILGETSRNYELDKAEQIRRGEISAINYQNSAALERWKGAQEGGYGNL